MPLQIRRGPTADRLANTPLAGELVYDTTTGSVYVGNGTAPGGLPVTNFSVGDARTATARMFLGDSLSDNTVHSGVTFAYIGNRLQATVAQDLSNYIGQIVASDGFRGNVVGDDSGVIVNSDTHTIYGNFVAQGDILPDTNIAYDLGSSTYRFRDIYLSGSSIYLGNSVITSTGTAIDIPTGSTVGGQALGINEGDTYNITISGNVIGTDSTVLVNTTNGTFRGDLIGSVFADDSTMLVDGRDGVLRGTLIGNADTATSATSASVASNVSLVDSSSSSTTHYITFSLGTSGTRVISADTSLTYQPSTNTLGTGGLNTTTIIASSVSATTVTGTNLFTSLIDSADSSAITVTPAIVFSSDVTVENELFIGGDIFPDTSESYSLGSYTKKFGKLYLTEGDNALWIGNATISGNGTVINLPAGSTVGGSAITTAAGSNATTITVNSSGTNADHFISFFDAQSGNKTILTDDTFKYNPGTGIFTVGDAVIGSVTGNLIGNVTGSVTGSVTGNIFTNLIDSADSSAISVTPAVVFNSDITVQNELFATKIFSNVIGDITGNVTGNVTGNITGNVTGNVSGPGTSSFGSISVTTLAGLPATTVTTNSYSASSLFGVTQAHSTTDARNVSFSRARGTISAPTIVQTGDDLADLIFVGYGTSAYVTGAQITAIVEDVAPTNTSMKTKLVFSTNTGAGIVDHVTLDSAGLLTVNDLNLAVDVQTTVGAPGPASALPVTPTTYFKIKVNGVDYVIPAYAVS